MSHGDTEFMKYATEYDPIKIGSVDGTDTEPHDRAITRALNSEYTVNKRVKDDPKFTVFVGRLNPRTTEETVRSEFSKFGKIRHCQLIRDLVTGKSKQYAFIEYESEGNVAVAVRGMYQEQIDGAAVVTQQSARRLAGWRPRRLGGGFGGRKEAGQLRFGCQDRPWKRPILIQKTIDRSTDHTAHRR